MFYYLRVRPDNTQRHNIKSESLVVSEWAKKKKKTINIVGDRFSHFVWRRTTTKWKGKWQHAQCENFIFFPSTWIHPSIVVVDVNVERKKEEFYTRVSAVNIKIFLISRAYFFSLIYNFWKCIIIKRRHFLVVEGWIEKAPRINKALWCTSLASSLNRTDVHVIIFSCFWKVSSADYKERA